MQVLLLWAILGQGGEVSRSVLEKKGMLPGDDKAARDALAALDAAHTAQPAWAATPPRERGEILRRAFETLMARSDELALLMTLEMGKPLAESKAEIAYAAEFLRWYSEEAVRISGGYNIAPAGGSRLLVMRQPVGPTERGGTATHAESVRSRHGAYTARRPG